MDISEKSRNPPSLLLITRNLPPLIGGMERLNWHIADQLSRYGQVNVVGPAGARTLAPREVHLYEVALRPLWRFLMGAGLRALIVASKDRPTCVLAGSGLTAPLAWLTARLKRTQAAVYLHGLDIVVDQPLYRAVWLPLIRRMDCVVVNSNATKKLAITAGISEQKIHIVPPGVTLPAEAFSPMAVRDFRRSRGLEIGPILLSVGRLTARKGLLEFVRDILPSVVVDQPQIKFVIVGNAPDDALQADIQTPGQIQTAAEASGVGAHLHFVGAVKDWDELGAIYRAADLHVFPVQQIPRDPEGFGMVAVEAAAFGLPTIAYATGGIIDAVAEGESGYLISPGDVRGMVKSICRALDNPLSTKMVRQHAERFAWPKVGAELAMRLGMQTSPRVEKPAL